MLHVRFAACGASLLVCVLGCVHPAASTRVSDGRQAMGTILEITLYVAEAEQGRLLLDRLYNRVAALEAEITTWNEASAASRLNAAAGTEPVAVPPALRALLTVGVQAALETEGVFDVSVGPLIALWRQAGERGRIPTASEIDAARRRVGAERIALVGNSAALAPEMTISFDGVAKGWALDRLGEMLENEGIERVLLDFGGSSWLARGAPPNAAGWRVLIADQAGRRSLIVLRDESLSVSESLGQNIEIDGRSFSHVIDPRSGWPVETRRLTAVRSPLGAEAEIWSTALLIFSEEEGRRRIDEHEGLEALWIEADGRAHHTEGFAVEWAVDLHGSGGP
ncbi:MAG: FAD:protein FMN transferase [Deltaproteobacteria bacterium]|nr:FAD:protein FMN transferase [Deltaproteobacteria bacterium]MBW2393224.1 FAD:protein FMN transferase [Deltaproteobacteria bacterium]